jgi:elongation factor G
MGHPVVDVRVMVFDGSYHEVDSSEVAFNIAASIAFKEGVKRAGGVLLEPIMEVEVVTPEEFMGDVIGDMSARRGRITRVTPRAGARVISARIPLAELFRYATDLLSLSQGQAMYTMPFGCYQEAPDKFLRHGSDDQTA